MLSGILKCPVCGGPMHILRTAIDKKQPENGSYYYYVCYNSRRPKSVKCTYRKHVREEVIDYYVEGLIPELLNSPKLLTVLNEELEDKSKKNELEEIILNYKRVLAETTTIATNLENEIDNLKIDIPCYEIIRKKNTERLYKLYGQIEEINDRIEKAQNELTDCSFDEIGIKSIKDQVIDYDRLFRNLTKEEKKTFCRYLFKSISIYPDFEDVGKIVKSVELNFRAYKKQDEINEQIVEAKSSKEIIDAMSNEAQVKTVSVPVDIEEFGLNNILVSRAKEALALTYNPRSRRGPYNKHKVTYKRIKEYVKEKYGIVAHTAYIAEMKRKYGYEMEEAYNKVEKLKHPRKHPTQEMQDAITDAFLYFGVISNEYEPRDYDGIPITYQMIQEFTKKYFNINPQSRYIAEVKRMHGLQMHSSRSKENAVCKKSVPKNVQYAIEKALVYFKLINEEQVTDL